jgi:hypothetical protein
MDRAYGTLIIGLHVQWVKTHCYKIFRADGSLKGTPTQTVIRTEVMLISDGRATFSFGLKKTNL